MVGAIPEKYQWVINLVGMEGGVELGLAELKSLLQDEEMEMYHSEVLFLTTFLQLNMTNNEIAYKQLLDVIASEYSDNYLLNFAAARLSHALGKNALCIKVLENRPADQGKYPFHYLDYLQGISYLYSLDYEKSEMYFNRFLKNFKGNNYIKSAYLNSNYNIYKVIEIGKNKSKTIFKVNKILYNIDIEKDIFTFDKNKYEGYYIERI